MQWCREQSAECCGAVHTGGMVKGAVVQSAVGRVQSAVRRVQFAPVVQSAECSAYGAVCTSGAECSGGVSRVLRAL